MIRAHSSAIKKNMGSPPPHDIVHAYLNAIGARDFERAREYLSNEHFTFRGPIANFDSADQFIADSSRVASILEGIEWRKTFVDGDQVCDILTFVTRFSVLTRTTVVHWATVEKGKISSIDVFFDARGYTKLFEDPSAPR